MDEKLTVDQAAARVGIQPGSWRGMVTRGTAPAKDGEYDRRTPWWWASNVDRWNADRQTRISTRRSANAAQ